MFSGFETEKTKMATNKKEASKALLAETSGPEDTWQYAHEIAEDAIEEFELTLTVDDLEEYLRELIW
jgi:hypothetical protein